MVSVIMPVHNGAATLREAAISVLAEQTVAVELLVVNDGSTDETVSVVSRLQDERVRLIDSPARGIAHAVNAGLAAATGTLFMRCDADDRFAQGRIARQVAWLRQRPEVGALCGRFATITDEGEPITEMATGDVAADIGAELRQGQPRTHFGTFAVRTQLLRTLGGCRPFFESAEDIDLQLRLSEMTRVFYTPELAYYYRLHNGSHIHQMGSQRRRWFDTQAVVFQQQRLATGQDALQRGVPPTPPPDDGVVRSAETHVHDLLLGQAWREHAQGQRWQAVRTGLRAVQQQPTSWPTWRSLVALTIKREAARAH